MSKFLGENLKGLSPYVPGEQIKDKKYIKINEVSVQDGLVYWTDKIDANGKYYNLVYVEADKYNENYENIWIPSQKISYDFVFSKDGNTIESLSVDQEFTYNRGSLEERKVYHSNFLFLYSKAEQLHQLLSSLFFH